jgi:hypothetical protein
MQRVASSAIVLGLMACASTTSVSYDHDQNYDFGGLQSWDWVASPGQVQGAAGARSPLVEARIRDAIERELSAKGYRRVEGGEPDFRVAYHGGSNEKLDVRTTYDYYGYRWRTAVATTDVREYTEGTLLIDVVDGVRKELVWRGIGVAEVYADNPQEVTEQVNKVVSDVLKGFPPGL